MKKIILLALLLLLIGCQDRQPDSPLPLPDSPLPSPLLSPLSVPSGPANPNASRDAGAVLTWLRELSSRDDNRVVSGQFIGHGTPSVKYNALITQVHTDTGEWIAMAGGDYKSFGSTDPRQYIAQVNTVMMEHWNGGGLVTISWHADNPWSGGDAWNVNSPGWSAETANVRDLMTPGNAAYNAWHADLDMIAEGLAQLRDAGVVVLWRPLHEMNFQNTFWWNAPNLQNRPQDFVDLWRYMFSYFDAKGLNNLLWVYSAGNSYTTPVDYLYPGDEFVDVVGVDVYRDSLGIRNDGYHRLLALDKPVFYGEVGPGSIRDGSWDNRLYIEKIKSDYPLIVGFQVWSSYWGQALAIVDNQNASGLLGDPWTVTRDEIGWRWLVYLPAVIK